MGNFRSTESRAGGITGLRLFLVCCFCVLVFPAAVDAIGNINNTKHNLSASGPGPLKSLTETRICVFCHTPHNAAADTPLWNKEIQSQNYTVYTSPTLTTPQPLPQPFGPTKLCLSCHDGTIALGATVGGGNLDTSLGAIPSAGPNSGTYFGLDLSMHHPVSFSYLTAFPNAELVPARELPGNLDFGGSDFEVHCTTCHDPHDDTNGNFLVMNNSFSALCTVCHQMTGWSLSGHSTLQQGCEVCHTPHFAVAVPLLNYTSSDYCLTCHSPVPTAPTPPSHGETIALNRPPTVLQATPDYAAPRADIKSQIEKVSNHRERAGLSNSILSNLKASDRALLGDVTCADCHNPHAANKKKAVAPYASGMVFGTSGLDRNGKEVSPVTYEYEICFKCHADYTTDTQYIPRVVATTNMRLAFDTANPSYHPVEGMGRSMAIPSIPSQLEPALNAAAVIYCTACHRDDAGGSKGPHGSSFAPILRERYETADGTLESYDNYALCYRCHNRTSILDDVSFRKKINRKTASGGGHSGHLTTGAPCSACHDPHGINVTLPMKVSGTGSHTHLINFDTRIVLPKPGSPYPIYNDTGNFSGSCTLVCHGVVHDSLSYP